MTNSVDMCTLPASADDCCQIVTAHLDCGLELHSVGFAKTDGDSEDRHHLSLVVTIEGSGQLLQAALHCVPQSILHFLVNLSHKRAVLQGSCSHCCEQQVSQ